MGRPRKHDPAAVMAKVCERISAGELVKDVAADLGVPESHVRAWGASDEFSAAYARARDEQAHALAERVITESRAALGLPSEGVQAKRLEVDALKWLASKIAPRHYGERQTHEVSGPGGAAIPVAVSVTRRIVRPGDGGEGDGVEDGASGEGGGA